MERISPGSKKWPPTAWHDLLRLALPALEALPAGMSWALGGGTALALTLAHRVSFDIDVFFTDSRALRLLSPNRNPLVRAISDRWQEPGNYIKIERPEGEIDFLVARTFSDEPAVPYDFEGRIIMVETPFEILAKKVHYRGSRFTVRDIFDTAMISLSAPEVLPALVDEMPQAVRRTLDRMAAIKAVYADTIRQDVNPTETGSAYLDAGYDIAAAAFGKALAGHASAPCSDRA
jgi:hypothetical protein